METDKIASEIQTREYLRERLRPEPRDFFYLSLSDLSLALEAHGTDEPIVLLDYGCGGSPYRSYFPNSDYRRADHVQAPGDELDYLLPADSLVNESDEVFDIVLSTQVAEHVVSPESYFSECFRLLKPGGKLICSTHGYFPDHGCPYDFQRWTADGLKRDLEKAGFEVESVSKTTTGARAMFSTLDLTMHELSFRMNTLHGIALRVLTKLFGFFRPGIYRWLDRERPEERIMIDRDNRAAFYIGLFAVAAKKQK